MSEAIQSSTQFAEAIGLKLITVDGFAAPPEPNFIEHITLDGERWDLIAWRFYGDPAHYVIILAANPHVAIAPVLASGIRLRVPIIEETELAPRDLPPWVLAGRVG